MQRTIEKYILFLSVLLAILWASSANAQKVYSAEERKIEESRITRDIAANLDWHNRPPETLDDISDEKRWLYARTNESILLRRATGERFGIFESFDDRTNKKIFEVRLHTKSNLTDRFRPFQNNCDGASLVAEKADPRYILFREICSAHGRPTGHTLYLFDHMSRLLLWIYSAKVADQKKPTIALTNGNYEIRWDVTFTGSTSAQSIRRNFRLILTRDGKWKVLDMPPINEEIDRVVPNENLPLDTKYNLPAFVSDWGK